MARDSANTWYLSLPKQQDSVVRRIRQPYTKIVATVVPSVQATPAGPLVLKESVYLLEGYTPELQFVDEDFRETWEYHDLGRHADLLLANLAAASWREARVLDEYPIT